MPAAPVARISRARKTIPTHPQQPMSAGDSAPWSPLQTQLVAGAPIRMRANLSRSRSLRLKTRLPPQLSSVTASQGVPIGASTGTWANNPTRFSYQWLSCPSKTINASCALLPEVESSHQYTPTAHTVGSYLAVAVTAYNEYGSSTADSDLSEPVTEPATQGGWSEVPVDLPLHPQSVSCPSTSFCVAVDNDGNAVTYNGSSWGAPTGIDSDVSLTSVSCPSTSFCLALARDGNVVTYNGSSWSASASTSYVGEGGLSSVSCASASFCVAVGASGLAETYNGSSWSAPTSLASEEGGLNSVSCPSASFCVAVARRRRVDLQRQQMERADADQRQRRRLLLVGILLRRGGHVWRRSDLQRQ